MSFDLVYSSCRGGTKISFAYKFSKDICDARQRMGLTQEQCAEALHLSIREFQNIEAGRFTPRLPTFLRIIDFFGLDFDDYREAVS